MRLTPDDILNPGLKGLKFDSWAHLFRWPGELVKGDQQAIATERPTSPFTEKSLEDWRLNLSPPSSRPIASWRAKTVQAGGRLPSLDDLRKKHLQTIKEEIIEPGLARPNLSAAFDAVQAIAIREGIANPYFGAGKLPQISLSEDENGSYFSGASWVFSALTQDAIQLELIPLTLLMQIRVEGAAVVIVEHLLSQKPQEHIEAHLEQLIRNRVQVLQSASFSKISSCETEMQRWLSAIAPAVLNPDKSINHSYSLCNAATGLVGIARIQSFALAVRDVALGVDRAVSALGVALNNH